MFLFTFLANVQEQIQHAFTSRDDSICQKMPVASIMTPISTILPQLGDISDVSSLSGSPHVRTLTTPNLRIHPPCHVPSPEPLDVRRLQQHFSLENFPCEPPAELKDCESQTYDSHFVLSSVEYLSPPPPPRLPTIYTDTDLDFHTRTSLYMQSISLLPPLNNTGQSRSHENLRCVSVAAMPTGPDVIAVH